jgi:hypothetical protein
MSLGRLHNQLENMMAQELVDTLLRHGYAIRIDNGESSDGSEFELDFCTDRATILEHMALTDIEELWVRRGPRGKHKWIKLIYGEGVPDLICDYSVTLEDLVSSVADRWETDDRGKVHPMLIDAWLVKQALERHLKLEPGGVLPDIEKALAEQREAVEALAALAWKHMPGGWQGEIEDALRTVGGRLREEWANGREPTAAQGPGGQASGRGARARRA